MSEKLTDYKVDATRGSSMINPERYKGDVLVQVWVDSRILATLSNWLDKKGVITRFMSQVIKEPLRVLVEHLVEDGEVEMVDDTVVARDLLQRKYQINLNPRGRGGKNILHNVVLSDRRKNLGDRLDDTEYSVNVPIHTAAGQREALMEQVERAKSIYKDIEQKKRIEEIKEVHAKIDDMEFVKDDE